jgi:hypothetical protein
MKTATSLTLVAAGAIIAFAITAHVSFLNLHVAGWVIILTGAAGAVIPRTSSWLRRTRADRGGTGAAAADGTSQRPPPSRPPTPRRQPAAALDAMPGERETIEEYAGA